MWRRRRSHLVPDHRALCCRAFGPPPFSIVNHAGPTNPPRESYFGVRMFYTVEATHSPSLPLLLLMDLRKDDLRHCTIKHFELLQGTQLALYLLIFIISFYVMKISDNLFHVWFSFYYKVSIRPDNQGWSIVGRVVSNIWYILQGSSTQSAMSVGLELNHKKYLDSP